MDELLARVAGKKAELHRRLQRDPRALDNLRHSHDLELTYSSNAIEGNTLTQLETSLVLDEGLTIGGKPLKDHLEAIDHHAALAYMREIARSATPLGEFEIRTLHGLVLKRSNPDIAGRYATAMRYVNTEAGRHSFPAPAEIPALMGDLGAWLRSAPDNPETAFAAHLRLVDIHPFDDGNGRTARLLMNLVLLRGGYPPIAIRPEHRLRYLRALQSAQAGGGDQDFRELLYARLDSTLDEYLGAFGQG